MTTVEVAEPGDWAYLEALRRRESDALGFVPRERYASVLERRPTSGCHRYLYEAIALARDEGEPTGFCYSSAGKPGAAAKVYQVVVQEDARRWERALALVTEAENRARIAGAARIEARVAADLEANLFWKAAGYAAVSVTKSTAYARGEAKSGREIVVYRKELLGGPCPSLWEAS